MVAPVHFAQMKLRWGEKIAEGETRPGGTGAADRRVDFMVLPAAEALRRIQRFMFPLDGVRYDRGASLFRKAPPSADAPELRCEDAEMPDETTADVPTASALVAPPRSAVDPMAERFIWSVEHLFSTGAMTSPPRRGLLALMR